MSFYKIYFTSTILFAIIYTIVEVNNNKYIIKNKDKVSTINLYSITFLHAVFYFTMLYTLLFIILIYKVPKNFILGYIIYITILIIHWKTNNDQCIITNIFNDQLNLPKNLGFRGVQHIYDDTYPVVSSDNDPIEEDEMQKYYYTAYFFVIYSLFLYYIKP